ncbi:MAG TPA: hypothetical protein VFD63_26245 [Pyrinomonadaceae bacterium]|nr:hypothetical protein [Pyrinomonadaceae bacterium]
MSSEQARSMAERIARRISANALSDKPVSKPGTEVSSELAAIRENLSQLQNRLIQIESKIGGSSSDSHSDQVANARIHSPWLAGVNASHPSQERFGVEEAVVSELVDFFHNEKTCSVEPGGKPCDHCAMCSSRGF